VPANIVWAARNTLFAISGGARAKVTNCLFAGNVAAIRGGGIVNGGRVEAIFNNITAA